MPSRKVAPVLVAVLAAIFAGCAPSTVDAPQAQRSDGDATRMNNSAAPTPRPPTATDIPPVEPLDLPWNFCVAYVSEPGEWIEVPRSDPAIAYVLARTTAHLVKRGIETISYERELYSFRVSDIGNVFGDSRALIEPYLIPADVFVEISLRSEDAGPNARRYIVTAKVFNACSTRVWANAVGQSDVVTNQATGLAQATDRAIAMVIPRLKSERTRELERGREYYVVVDASLWNPDAPDIVYDVLSDQSREVTFVRAEGPRIEVRILVEPDATSVDVLRELTAECANHSVRVRVRRLFRRYLILRVE